MIDSAEPTSGNKLPHHTIVSHCAHLDESTLSPTINKPCYAALTLVALNPALSQTLITTFSHHYHPSYVQALQPALEAHSC